MIEEIEKNKSYSITNPISGRYNTYIFDNGKSLLVSRSISEILTDHRIKKSLSISNKGISFLLRNGVIPSPYSIFDNFYILQVGDKLIIDEKGLLKFEHVFPFEHKEATKIESFTSYKELFLKKLNDSLHEQIKPEYKKILFHSAGKDSNSIALAIAKNCNIQDYELVTHRSKGAADESQISKRIANKLGFKHTILEEIDTLNASHKEHIVKYFETMPVPVVDSLTLAYPLYNYQYPELNTSNFIFGDGNDGYLYSLPTKKQQLLYTINNSRVIQKLINKMPSEHFLNPLGKSKLEIFGLDGFSESDSKMIFSNYETLNGFWNQEGYKYKSQDIITVKSDIYATKVITGRMIRKLENFCNAYGSKMVLPFASMELIEFFQGLPLSMLYNKYRNKSFIRDILKNDLDLDSDKIGKKGWSYDVHKVVHNNYSWIESEVLRCNVWNNDVITIMNRLRSESLKGTKYSKFSAKLIYRIFLISMWINHSKYLRNDLASSR